MGEDQNSQPGRVIVYSSQSEAGVDEYLSENPAFVADGVVVFLPVFLFVAFRILRSRDRHFEKFSRWGTAGRNGVGRGRGLGS